jgi:hypothetical protein
MTRFLNIGGSHTSAGLRKLAKELDTTTVISEDFKMTIWLCATSAFLEGVATGETRET